MMVAVAIATIFSTAVQRDTAFKTLLQCFTFIATIRLGQPWHASDCTCILAVSLPDYEAQNISGTVDEFV